METLRRRGSPITPLVKPGLLKDLGGPGNEREKAKPRAQKQRVAANPGQLTLEISAQYTERIFQPEVTTGAYIIGLTGGLMEHTIDSLRNDLVTGRPWTQTVSETTIIIDCSNLQLIDRSGIGALRWLAQIIHKHHRAEARLFILKAPPSIKNTVMLAQIPIIRFINELPVPPEEKDADAKNL